MYRVVGTELVAEKVFLEVEQPFYDLCLFRRIRVVSPTSTNMPRFGCFDRLIGLFLPWCVLKVLGEKTANVPIGASADLLKYAWCDEGARLFTPSL